METPTLRDVLHLKEPTRGFLCPLSANVFGVEFLSFRIRDYETGTIVYEASSDVDDEDANPYDESLPEDALRTVRYELPTSFLQLKNVGTTLVFRVGPREVPELRMIERHYFRNRLLKSFDFTFGFCIPNSTNSWEAIYPVPSVSKALERDMVAHPYETRSDSFYFVRDQLIMHNKAEYAYISVDRP